MKLLTCSSQTGSPSRRGNRALRIHVDQAIDDPHRRYGLSQLLEIIGAPHRFARDAYPDIYYGDDLVIGRAARVWIRPEPVTNWREHPPHLTMMDGIAVLHHGAAPPTLTERNLIDFDLPLCAAYWLTLDSEARTWQRDAHGRVRAADSLLGRSELLERPPLHGYAILLADMIWPVDAPCGLIARWPEGKRWAVALTHDVDRPERPSRVRSLLHELIRPKRMSRREAYYSLRAEISSRGLVETLFCSPGRRREWDFRRFIRLEKGSGLRSAFYFAVINRGGGHPCDVAYDAGVRRFRREMNRLEKLGLEVGLHASYGTRWDCPPSARQREKLGAHLRARPAGVRHHYLHLDPDDPMRTILQHEKSGFEYDSSIGFNDRPGFRAGTPFPFSPWQQAVGAAQELIELPMTLADMHLPTDNREEAIRLTLSHLNRTREMGGLAVINWHIGHWHSDSAWRGAFQAACDFVAHDKSVWCATPSEIAAWWRERRRKIGAAPIDAESTEIRSRPAEVPKVRHWPPESQTSETRAILDVAGSLATRVSQLAPQEVA